MVFPIMAAVQAGMGLLESKKKAQEARRTNAARAALGEAPTADPGDGGKGGLMGSLGGLMGGMGGGAAAGPPPLGTSPADAKQNLNNAMNASAKPFTGPVPQPAPKLPPPPPALPNPALGSPAGPPTAHPNSFTPEGTQELLDQNLMQ